MTLGDVGAMLVARRHPLAEAAVRETRADAAAYATIEDSAVLADVLDNAREGFVALGTYLASGPPHAEPDMGFVRRHAAKRVQRRVPLASFMHGIRIGHRTAWNAVLEWTADQAGGREVALLASGLLIDFFNQFSTIAAHAYLDAEQLLAVEDDRVRRDLLEDLLGGRDPAPGPRLMRAREAGLTREASCVVLVAVPVKPISDDYGLRSAAASLGGAVGGAARSLTVVRQDEIVVVRSVREELGEQFTRRVRSEWRALADKGTRLAVGISTCHKTVATVADAYHEALTALDVLPDEGGVAALFEMKVIDYLTLRANETARRLIPSAVRDFVVSDSRSGGVLTETVLSYARANLNVKAAAQALGVHINTAHHRLTRVERRTGYDLRRLPDLQELLIAITFYGDARSAL
ncbi:CdaR family transcriptional regulator [Saccharopolyspora erythraea NRRL 2338]|uniref:Possible transcriptional regulator n=3 Tax=Saccharopolyspora erythraea TaxID=1836 RepID=A4FCS0_SACEN|nr:transcriptional regulator [Saccharopolyspora erythraea D]PFG95600.1 CdaR family transcriptional regulator [Saccharopolyspora erythraea NRRL 2338]CAM01845.1 possible transcriptional regulator [Saccharopolyspora erythraea NRRL 2338]